MGSDYAISPARKRVPLASEAAGTRTSIARVHAAQTSAVGVLSGLLRCVRPWRHECHPLSEFRPLEAGYTSPGRPLAATFGSVGTHSFRYECWCAGFDAQLSLSATRALQRREHV